MQYLVVILTIFSFIFSQEYFFKKKHVTSATIIHKPINISSVEGDRATTDDIIPILESRNFRRKVLKKIDKIPPLLILHKGVSSYTEKLKEIIKIRNIPQTNIYEISIESNLPNNDAVLLINTYIETLIEHEREWINLKYSAEIEFFSKQLKITEEELTQKEQELREFQENEGIPELSDVKKYSRYKRLQDSIARLEESYKYIRQKLEEVKIEEASHIGTIRVLDTPLLIELEKPDNRNLDVYWDPEKLDKNGYYHYPYQGYNYGTINFSISNVDNYTLVGWDSPDQYCVMHWGTEICESVIDGQTYSDQNGYGQQNFYMNETFIGDTLRLIGFINYNIIDEIYVIIK
tara:strand:- start:413 stop:1456 length:1044 start_codon:yes stop_codon:yes gene_type:complete